MNTPVMYEDMSRNDFAGGSFTSFIETESGRPEATITISLDSPYLQSLVDSGAAVWMAEVRSPRGFYSDEKRLNFVDNKASFDWDESRCADITWIVPSLYASENIAVSKSELSAVWKNYPTVTISKGCRIVYGSMQEVVDRRSSALLFKKDNGNHCEAGEVYVELDETSGKIVAWLAPDIWGLRKDRTMAIAAIGDGIGTLRHKYETQEEASVSFAALCRLIRTKFDNIWELEDTLSGINIASALEPFRSDIEDEDDEDYD